MEGQFHSYGPLQVNRHGPFGQRLDQFKEVEEARVHRETKIARARCEMFERDGGEVWLLNELHDRAAFFVMWTRYAMVGVPPYQRPTIEARFMLRRRAPLGGLRATIVSGYPERIVVIHGAEMVLNQNPWPDTIKNHPGARLVDDLWMTAALANDLGVDGRPL